MIQSIFIERVAVLGGYFARAVGRAAKLTWLRLIAITANYALAKSARILPDSAPGIAIFFGQAHAPDR